MEALTAPRVSVVMSVFNAADFLAQTLDSVLAQEGVEFEFLVVDDGSTDGTAGILANFASRDPRLRPLPQSNTGLTRALARACGEARGEFIARQDAGDLSMPDRLRSQVAFLDAHPHAVMTACGVRFAGPGHEPLYEKTRAGQELDEGLRQPDTARLRGPPHHGASVYRRAAYEAAGGYRLPFVVAQDIDLWLRMSENGVCLGTADIGYLAVIHAGSISARRRDEQFALGQLALDCARARREGADEQTLLRAFAIPPIQLGGPAGRGERARFHYFIASCLRSHNREAARRYLRLALRDNPFHLRAWLRALVG